MKFTINWEQIVLLLVGLQKMFVHLRLRLNKNSIMNTKLSAGFATRLQPQYIKDSAGNLMVVLSHHDYSSILAEIEEWEDSMLYLQAKRNDDGERIPMEVAFAEIEKAR